MWASSQGDSHILPHPQLRKNCKHSLGRLWLLTPPRQGLSAHRVFVGSRTGLPAPGGPTPEHGRREAGGPETVARFLVSGNKMKHLAGATPACGEKGRANQLKTTDDSFHLALSRVQPCPVLRHLCVRLCARAHVHEGAVSSVCALRCAYRRRRSKARGWHLVSPVTLRPVFGLTVAGLAHQQPRATPDSSSGVHAGAPHFLREC